MTYQLNKATTEIDALLAKYSANEGTTTADEIFVDHGFNQETFAKEFVTGLIESELAELRHFVVSENWFVIGTKLESLVQTRLFTFEEMNHLLELLFVETILKLNDEILLEDLASEMLKFDVENGTEHVAKAINVTSDNKRKQILLKIVAVYRASKELELLNYIDRSNWDKANDHLNALRLFSSVHKTKYVRKADSDLLVEMSTRLKPQLLIVTMGRYTEKAARLIRFARNVNPELLHLKDENNLTLTELAAQHNNQTVMRAIIAADKTTDRTHAQRGELAGYHLRKTRRVLSIFSGIATLITGGVVSVASLASYTSVLSVIGLASFSVGVAALLPYAIMSFAAVAVVSVMAIGTVVVASWLAPIIGHALTRYENKKNFTPAVVPHRKSIESKPNEVERKVKIIQWTKEDITKEANNKNWQAVAQKITNLALIDSKSANYYAEKYKNLIHASENLVAINLLAFVLSMESCELTNNVLKYAYDDVSSASAATRAMVGSSEPNANQPDVTTDAKFTASTDSSTTDKENEMRAEMGPWF